MENQKKIHVPETGASDFDTFTDIMGMVRGLSDRFEDCMKWATTFANRQDWDYAFYYLSAARQITSYMDTMITKAQLLDEFITIRAHRGKLN